MRHFFWFIIFGLSLTSCGEFFQFEEEPDTWEGIAMKIAHDSPYVMVSDSLPLAVTFTPDTISDGAIFWMLGDNTRAMLKNDTLVALRSGQVDLIAIGGAGRLTDTCRVNIIDPWIMEDFSAMHPSDMVIYADIRVDGLEWNDSTSMVAAFVGGELSGMAKRREACGITYAEFRIWAPTNLGQGHIDFRCYDRSNYRLMWLKEDIEFDAYKTLGTLSNLYPLNFSR